MEAEHSDVASHARLCLRRIAERGFDDPFKVIADSQAYNTS
jgi:hypothetical protein